MSRIPNSRSISFTTFLLLLGIWIASDAYISNSLSRGVVHAFVGTSQPLKLSSCPLDRRRTRHASPTNPQRVDNTQLHEFSLLLVEPAHAATGLKDYAPAATSLFNNMKLPAAVVTAGMISLGFATSFPELPQESPTTHKPYPKSLRDRCESLQRLHIVVALISVTSELVVVLWSAVEVNQLTERKFALANSVWDLIQRDCDLAWSAVNSHFTLGIIGFITMLALRAYVMLLAAEASAALMTAASTGTAAALCLCLSIVNRGVESGGGDGNSYGATIFDLLSHYAVLLAQAATSEVSPGPLQLTAIVLEITSLSFLANVLLFQNGKIDYGMDRLSANNGVGENGVGAANGEDDDLDDEEDDCPIIDIVPSSASQTNGNATDAVRVVVASSNSDGSPSDRSKVARCLAREEEQKETERKAQRNREEQARKRRRRDSDDPTVGFSL